MHLADNEGIQFHTSDAKNLYRQILKNPHAEACFVSPDNSIQVRVSGTAEVVEDMDLKKEHIDLARKPDDRGTTPAARFRPSI